MGYSATLTVAVAAKQSGRDESIPAQIMPSVLWSSKVLGYASEGSMSLQALTRPFTAATELSNIACSSPVI